MSLKRTIIVRQRGSAFDLLEKELFRGSYEDFLAAFPVFKDLKTNWLYSFDSPSTVSSTRHGVTAVKSRSLEVVIVTVCEVQGA